MLSEHNHACVVLLSGQNDLAGRHDETIAPELHSVSRNPKVFIGPVNRALITIKKHETFSAQAREREGWGGKELTPLWG